MGVLLGGSMVGLMATSSKRAYATGLLHAEPLPLQQATADPYLHRRHSNTQGQVWFSLCGVSGSWCAQGFVWAFRASPVSMEFASKHDFTLSTVLLGRFLCPWTWVSFFGGIQHSPVDGCSAASCNFGVLVEKMSGCPSTLPSLLSMAPPIRTRPSLPHSQFLPSGSFQKSLILIHQSAGTHNENHNHRKLIKLITWTTALSNSMKLWAMLYRATQDGQFIMEGPDKTWSTGKGNGKPLQYSCLENPMNSIKRQKDMILKDMILISLGRQVPNMLLQISGEITPEWRDGAKAKTTPSCEWDWWWKQGSML